MSLQYNTGNHHPDNLELTLLDSPVFYCKSPVVYESYHDPRSTKSLDELKIYFQNEHISKPIKDNTLDKLPFEIRLKIANQLSQFDCLNLLRTNKAMYLSTIPRLYQHIIIDQDYSQFNREYEFKHYNNMDDFNDYEDFSCSYIKSPYNFKRFLHYYIQLHLAHENDSSNYNKFGPSETFPYIRKIQCINIPDSLNIYDYELNYNLSEFFLKLSHLNELIWLNDNFKLEYLEMLPNRRSISTLVLNIKFSNYLTELHTPKSLDYNSDVSDDEESSKILQFPNLTNFQIRPFQNSNRLIKIINSLLTNTNPKTISEHLKILKISRFDKDISVLVPPCNELVTTSEVSPLNELDLGTIKSLFTYSDMKHLNNLSILLFNNCLLTPDDSTTLQNSINLGNLKKLELKNVSEYQRINTTVGNQNELRDSLQTSFIVRIGPHLTNLQHLLIDYRECLTDSVPEFLNILPSNKLQSLDLTIRYNQTKLKSFNEDIREYYIAYSRSLVSQNKCNSLKKLSIETKEENTFCDLSIPLPSDFFYTELRQCTNLRSLRLNPCDSNSSEKVLQLISNLPKLTMLDVFGTRAGGAPHLGLGMVHPAIFDEWFKVQHVAILYLQHNSRLRYIRINKCIFECDGENVLVNPRDGIERWFNERARVGFIIDT